MGKNVGNVAKKEGPYKYGGNTAATKTTVSRYQYRHIVLMKCDCSKDNGLISKTVLKVRECFFNYISKH